MQVDPKGRLTEETKEQGAMLSELARLHTEMALDTLVDIASNGKNENARIAAATAILDRGYGRAAPIPLKELEPTDLPPMVIKLIGAE